MLNWFDLHPNAYWWIVCGTIVVQFGFICYPLFSTNVASTGKGDWRWAGAILLLLAAGRWPSWFITHQFNDDESFLITGARTLRHHPLFWRFVDGGTAGPLDFYALLPIGTCCGSDNYFSARLTAFFLVSAALIFTHQALAIAFGRQIARTTLFSATCVEALTYHPDLLHYSTELVPVALSAFALFLFARRFAANAPWSLNIPAGLALGAMPFAKLQSTPIALCLGLVWSGWELYHFRKPTSGRAQWAGLVSLAGAAIVPAGVFLVLVLANGLWSYVGVCYFKSNIAYAGAGSSVPLFSLLAFTGSYAANEVSLLLEWLTGGILGLLLLLPVSRRHTASTTTFAAVSIVLLFAALASILLPHRPFLHYWQFILVPWTLVIGCSLGLALTAIEPTRKLARCLVISAVLLPSVAGVFYARADAPMRAERQLVAMQHHSQGPIAREILKYAQVGEPLGIWGWMSNIAVESGMTQATRRMVTSAEIEQGPFSAYYREVYLADFSQSKPPVFVDAVGQGSLIYSNRKYSFDTIFPELAGYIEKRYTLVNEIDGSRIYVRNDRLASTKKTLD